MLKKWIGYIKAILAFMELLQELFGSREAAVNYVKSLTFKARRMDTDMAKTHFEGLDRTMGEIQ